MTQDADGLPNIYKAALEMSYDNGGINRDRSEEDHRADFDDLIGAEGYDFADLKKIDDWLSTLTADQINMLVAGDDEERMALIALIPYEIQQKTDELLNTLFDEVC